MKFHYVLAVTIVLLAFGSFLLAMAQDKPSPVPQPTPLTQCDVNLAGAEKYISVDLTPKIIAMQKEIDDLKAQLKK